MSRQDTLPGDAEGVVTNYGGDTLDALQQDIRFQGIFFHLETLLGDAGVMSSGLRLTRGVDTLLSAPSSVPHHS